MNNLKNKKRLGTTVIALMMVFLLGAAFALMPSTITIGGPGHLNPEQHSVVWGEQITVGQTLFLASPGNPHIWNQALDRTNDTTVTWSGSWTAAGTIPIRLDVTNESPTRVARIYEVDFWGASDAAFRFNNITWNHLVNAPVAIGNYGDINLGPVLSDFTFTNNIAWEPADVNSTHNTTSRFIEISAGATDYTIGTLSINWNGRLEPSMFVAGGAFYGHTQQPVVPGANAGVGFFTFDLPLTTIIPALP